jgi:hypothetical protein
MAVAKSLVPVVAAAWLLVAALPSTAHPMESLFTTMPVTSNSPVFHNPWTTEHHDSRNSGRSTAVYGVGTYNGTCQLAAAHAQPGFVYTSTGVTSSDGRKLYVGRYGLWVTTPGGFPWGCQCVVPRSWGQTVSLLRLRLTRVPVAHHLGALILRPTAYPTPTPNLAQL